MTDACQKPGCGATWRRDPILEVVCPTCGAAIGRRCMRPSEHRVRGEEPHAARDILGDETSQYGPCPLALCGFANVRRRQEADALPLFAHAGLMHSLVA